MQAELDDVCGENLPSLDDKSRYIINSNYIRRFL